MKALVTGGTGFIGQNVVDLLVENGHSVRLFSRRPELPARFAGKDVTLFQGDLADPDSVLDAMGGMDVVYHIGELKNTSAREAGKNVKLMERIIGRLGTAGVRRIVFVSSLTVAGIPETSPADEDTPPKVVLKDHYTSYKRECEKLLSRTVAGAEYAVVRPGFVVGPGSRPLSNLVSLIERWGAVGIPFPGKGAAIAPFVHVRGVARALYLAGVEPDAAGQVFNLVGGMGHSWSDFLAGIAKNLGKRLRIISVPTLFLMPPSVFFDVFSGIFGVTLGASAYLRYVTTDLVFDNGKTQRLLRWKPDFTLAQGVEELVREYRSFGASHP
jgi:dihydroflavonol-4-reductase